MDFGAMFQTWVNVLTKPGEATFEQERSSPQATLATAMIWIAVAAVILAIFSSISVLIGGFLNMGQLLLTEDLPPEFAGLMVGAGGGGIIMVFCLTLIFAPIGFLIGSGIYFAIAKALGGTGSFEEQSYLLATFTAPIMIVNGVIGLVPFLGGCFSFFLSIYQLVLSYFAIKTAHNLDTGRAIAVVLIPVAIALFCVICLVGVVFSTIGVAALGQ